MEVDLNILLAMNLRYIMIMMMYYILISACLFRSPSWETNPNVRTKPNYDHVLKIVYKRCPWNLLGSVLVLNHWFFLQNKRTLKMSSNDPDRTFWPAFSVHWTFEKYKHGWISCTSLSLSDRGDPLSKNADLSNSWP